MAFLFHFDGRCLAPILPEARLPLSSGTAMGIFIDANMALLRVISALRGSIFSLSVMDIRGDMLSSRTRYHDILTFRQLPRYYQADAVRALRAH